MPYNIDHGASENVYSATSFIQGKTAAENIIFLCASSGCVIITVIFFSEKWYTNEACGTLQNKKWLQYHYWIGRTFFDGIIWRFKKQKIKKFAVSEKTKLNLSFLTPTHTAARQHTLRTFQNQTWLSISLDPEEWGRKLMSWSLNEFPTNFHLQVQTYSSLFRCKCKPKFGCPKTALKLFPVCAMDEYANLCSNFCITLMIERILNTF